MTFRFIYSPYEHNRIIPAVLIDGRDQISAIGGKVGSVIKSYTDAQTGVVTDSHIFYKIETDSGNLAGYFTLNVGDASDVGVTLVQFELRPAFRVNMLRISTQIANFMSAGGWRYDTL